jgi:enoyl-CoA hydratase/carnithine racemase
MAPKTFMDVYRNGLFQDFTESFKQVSKPVIAAVNGYALGGN